MVTCYVPKQGMARTDAKPASPSIPLYLYALQHVAIPDTLWRNATVRAPMVQVGPSATKK